MSFRNSAQKIGEGAHRALSYNGNLYWISSIEQREYLSFGQMSIQGSDF